ncbi:MAG: 5'/3'-nucleotidase SurE [Spongiibacteraceae bacterium]
MSFARSIRRHTAIRCLFAALVTATLATVATPSHALKIMLVNDDGCNAPGINTLADALERAGHSVEIYAPASDQSGQGSRMAVPSATCHGISFNTSRVDLNKVTTSKPSRHCIATTIANCSAPFPPPFTANNQVVSASPFESTLVGLQVLNGAQTPDLVISGINRGENVGAVINNSGTVNAAVAAFRNGVPGIAVSLGVPAPDARYAEVAQLVVRIVDRLQKNANGGPLLPAQTGLNINYPGIGTPKGILFTKVGTFSTATISPHLQKDGTLTFSAVVDMKPHGTPVAEIEEEGVALREGYVSISTLDGDWGAAQSDVKEQLATIAVTAPLQ